MKYHWRDFQVFDEDPREKLEVSLDLGLCASWDRIGAFRANHVWKASQLELAASFIDEARSAIVGLDDPVLTEQTTDYARIRFCSRAFERAINS